LEISSGLLTFVNAGHNPPLLKKSAGEFEYLKTKKGFVLAGIKGFQYTQLEMTLNKGDTLFLYTDGVTEANDGEDNLYGEQRLQQQLNELGEQALSEMLDGVTRDIETFANGTPQFDDITMLALRIM
jgi:sigma-B regulation protein RsbU (phosphoserine phosphatase)